MGQKTVVFVALPNKGHPEKKLPFLRVLVSTESDGRLERSVFRKMIHTDMYLKADLHHRLSQKMAVVNTLVSRAIVISEPSSLHKEKEHLKRALEANGFP